MADIDWISLGTHTWVFISSVIFLGVVSRVDSQWAQARIKYCVAAAVISVVFSGFFAVPLEFITVRAKRWVILVLDHLQWMLLFAAAIILSDDIKTYSRNSRRPGGVSRETVRLVKTATAFAWVSTFFIFVLAIYDIFLVRSSEGIIRRRPQAAPLSGNYQSGTQPPAQSPPAHSDNNLEPEISPESHKAAEAV